MLLQESQPAACATSKIRIGGWCVDPDSGQILREGETVRLELRTMRLLLCLAEHAGSVVSIEHLLDHVWNGVTVTPDSVYQAVASLRRALGDDPKQPAYIATVPRLGYRMVAAVTPWEDATEGPTPTVAHSVGFALRRRTAYLLVACAALCVGLGMSAWLFHYRGKIVRRPGPQDQPLSSRNRRDPWRYCHFLTLLRE